MRREVAKKITETHISSGNYSEGFGEEDPKKRWAPTGIAAPPKDMKSAAAAGSKSDSKPEVVKSTPADSKPEIVKSTPASEPARNLYISGDQPASQTNAEVKKEEPVAVAPAKKEEPKAAEPAPSKPEVVKSTPASQPARDLYISGDQPASQTNSEIKKEEPKQEAAPVKKEEPKAVAPAPVAAAPAPVAAAPAPVKKEEPKAVAPSAVAAAAAAPAKSSSGGGLGGSQKCATCAKSVYPMERLVVDGIVFHKGKCFVCAECGNCLRPGNYASLGGKYYCKPHFKKLFQVKGFSFSFFPLLFLFPSFSLPLPLLPFLTTPKQETTPKGLVRKTPRRGGLPLVLLPPPRT